MISISNNIWVLDDKFMTYKTVLSEQQMDTLIGEVLLDGEVEKDLARPDLSLVFSGDPNGDEKVDVVIIELKKKGITLKDSSHIATQLLQRARKIIDSCPKVQRAWYYGIVEFTSELEEVLEDSKFIPLYSKGEMFYQDYRLKRRSDGTEVPTPIFIMSYDAVTKDASARNHTFLELLRSSFKKSNEDAKASRA